MKALPKVPKEVVVVVVEVMLTEMYKNKIIIVPSADFTPLY